MVSWLAIGVLFLSFLSSTLCDKCKATIIFIHWQEGSTDGEDGEYTGIDSISADIEEDMYVDACNEEDVDVIMSLLVLSTP
ncbi:hypothetical protein L2E82_16728 [Cichorium intybus]|uniref:Uncharacterized protein n=1 Tax=Cichorium intybus TaxID=13427 RepID=A0ACB9F5T5_CICIN|nr:hypothetical protein L2E82_16728 [Cichorium intybus]